MDERLDLVGEMLVLGRQGQGHAQRRARARSAWSSQLTGPRVMVVSRPSVARTVDLHTGTMGVHRACFLSIGPGRPLPRSGIARETILPILCILPLVAHQLAGARRFWRVHALAGHDCHTDRVLADRSVFLPCRGDRARPRRQARLVDGVRIRRRHRLRGRHNGRRQHGPNPGLLRLERGLPRPGRRGHLLDRGRRALPARATTDGMRPRLWPMHSSPTEPPRWLPLTRQPRTAGSLTDPA